MERLDEDLEDVDFDDPDDDPENEVIACCEGCECDVTRGEANHIGGWIYCDHCAWARTPASQGGGAAG